MELLYGITLYIWLLYGFALWNDFMMLLMFTLIGMTWTARARLSRENDDSYELNHSVGACQCPNICWWEQNELCFVLCTLGEYGTRGGQVINSKNSILRRLENNTFFLLCPIVFFPTTALMASFRTFFS